VNSHQLFRRSRVRLALWYVLVMGLILSVSGLGMYRALVQSHWSAIEREIESIAGTLHDSLEPRLPNPESSTVVLQKIFPDLCFSGKICNQNPPVIQRHTIGISDRDLYYIRLLDRQGKLLAFSPNQSPDLLQDIAIGDWQTLQDKSGNRYRQFTTILHSATADKLPPAPKSKGYWIYIQIGRNLETFDLEVDRIRVILTVAFLFALGLIALSSWWLSGLAMKPIYRSYQQQQQFTADAAHELRSPLASLLATVEAILRISQSSSQEIQTMVRTVERQGRRLSHLITDLLLLSSLEQNAAPLPFQPCCLNDLISDLIEEFSELAATAEVHLTCLIPELELYVLGNESQLYRLVSNLIANAIKYTPGGGQVIVTLEARDPLAVISVQDTGIGIQPEDQSRIFDRFYRVDSDRSRKTGGTGLGLTVARAIAHHHQGQLTVKSEPGAGSVFKVSLPKKTSASSGQKKR
jgi:two-component system, OmpR family, Ni(II)-sensor and/or redox sensor kinase NrsS